MTSSDFTRNSASQQGNEIDNALESLMADIQGKSPTPSAAQAPVTPSPPVKPTTPPSVPKTASRMERAKSGDSKAMTEVLNHLLQPKGIVSQVTLKTDVLFVLLQGTATPNQEEYVTYIRKFVTQLDLIFLNKISLTGRRKGATFAAWTSEIDLTKDNSSSLFASVASNVAGLGGAITGGVSQASQAITQSGNSQQQPNESQSLQDQLAERMMGLFDDVIKERHKYYEANPDKIPTQEDIASIIENCANTNAAIVGALNLVSGGFGMVVVIPEIIGTIKHQIGMIYDIGVAYDQQRVLDRELLAGIFTYALGQGALGLLTVQGSKVLVKRASIKVFHQVLKQIGSKITKQALKSGLSKYVPVLGAAAMAAWANYSTREIGKKATVILKQKIEYSPEVIDDIPDLTIDVEASTVEDSEATGIIDTAKIQALINLMKIDGKIEAEERQYVHLFVQNASVSEKDKIDLLMAVDNNTKFPIDYSQFASSPDDAIGLLIDMVALSQHDGDFHIAEKMYIKQVGKQMGIAESDVEEMIAN